MIYNSTIPANIIQAKTKLDWLIHNSKTFELKEKRQKRSISQNSYLHLLFSWFAYEYGETSEYVKQFIFKEVVNHDIFRDEYTNPKTGEIRDSIRSTSELNTKEMTIAIENFRNFSQKEAGIYLPEPNDLSAIQNMENQLINNTQ